MQGDGLDDGRYELRMRLGGGGMGDVWQAMDWRMRRPVAIKVLRPDLETDPAAKRRFVREWTITGEIAHENVVRAYDCGWGVLGGRDVMYLVMELLDGKTLNRRAAEETPGGVPLREIVSWCGDICRALEAAHEVNLVHRDIKPTNVQITASERVKLLDFGIACFQEDAEGNTRITEDGRVVGTYPYMSPEQIRAGRVDGRSDLYSLGCLLYELLAGRTPFVGLDVMRQHVQDIPCEPGTLRPGIPPDLNELVMDLLEKRPGNRPATAQEVRRRLDAISTAPPSPPRPPPPPPPPPRPSPSPPPPAPDPRRDHRELREMLGAGLIAGLGAFGLLLGAGGSGVVAAVIWGAVLAAAVAFTGFASNWRWAYLRGHRRGGPSEVIPCLGLVAVMVGLVGLVWLMAARSEFPWYYDFLIGLGETVGVFVLGVIAYFAGEESGESDSAGLLALLNMVLLGGLACVLFAVSLDFTWWTTALAALGTGAGALFLTAVVFETA
ncbi:serine/threonine-protein kinase [Streptomyces sp. NPDC047525]|uniref:serine/threonine-protein kinase n=1 Tax=Streptomyces sp. NPDC047525 TaxID=3155264 RepID=UPI003401416B